jgi:hypothetical protein
MTDSQNPNVQWHGKPNNEMLLRVQKWLKDGRTLFWLPIFSAENFPGTPWQVLCYAEQSSDRFCWIVKQIDDLLGIPEGITGWLLPEGDTDTDVVVGLWEGTLTFCKVVDRRNGEPQTLQSARTPEPDMAESMPT